MGGVRILVIQPSELDPPQLLGEWLTAAGAELDIVLPTEQGIPDSLEPYSALVVLGGGMGALDDTEYPWLSEVRALLSRAVGSRRPVLAVCLGAQLLAVATGGQVRPGRNGAEAGTLLVAKRDTAAEDVLLGPLPLTPDVLQFHRDEVTTLPPSAQLLASSPKCENQAFRVGDCAYGLQFHIETTTETALEWARETPDIAETARAGQFTREHLDAFHADLAETWQPMAERFVELAAQSPEERPGSRSLPIV
ncbi:GMP synthase-like glutamine amidotransferase [Halopolyspora algeriensis]|uniref:GMP synthase-like glutamine amidotransferase n=1 Tax=Halopolyspora algeriensis TaxID=1500506 RepID=A0A368VR55_9ACTN|nr:type 1 glutamine amidotransferase [Halopolyspora algeriensis]RCW44098.1 GMP synthase-like glutamine amidotransferase [Halopolyspora algeriensis]TQM53403.1 GMP synthase-like glutamine amidotransferase [Halopolyspora algeriensis]